VQPKRDDGGGVGMAENAEDAAFLAQTILIRIVPELGIAGRAVGGGGRSVGHFDLSGWRRRQGERPQLQKRLT